MTLDRNQAFDELVDQASEWVENPPSFGRGLKYFLWGFLNPFGFKFNRLSHPIYDNNGLTPKQKDVIMLASDVRRVGRHIEGVENEEKKAALKDAQEKLYNIYKSMF